MKRALLKWWIGRAIDESRDISTWLRSQIEGDDDLQQFERAAVQLARDLRRESPTWRTERRFRDDAQVMKRAVAGRKTARRVGFSLAALAVTCLLAGTLAWRARLADPTLRRPAADVVDVSAATGPTLSTPQASSRADTRALAEFLDAGRALVQPIAITWPDRLIVPPRLAANVQATYRKLPIVPRAGRLWEDLTSTITTERRMVATDLRSAFEFFSRRLPVSAGRLMGIRITDGRMPPRNE